MKKHPLSHILLGACICAVCATVPVYVVNEGTSARRAADASADVHSLIQQTAIDTKTMGRFHKMGYAEIHCDREHKITKWAGPAQALFLYTEVEIAGSPIELLMREEKREEHFGAFEKAMKAQSGTAHVIQCRDAVNSKGEALHVELILLADTHGAVALIRSLGPN